MTCSVAGCVWAVVAVAAVAAAAVAARELDPATCAARFDVQRDKIIRTEESQEMGARYLSELDVGSRAECLRLCCETDACDVFVYEEKSPGSCYLFSCGPPEQFRCKFTAHGNFSSGVLALGRRLAELQDQERLAQRHRAADRPPAAPGSAPSAPPPPRGSSPGTPPPPPAAPPPAPQQQAPPAHPPPQPPPPPDSLAAQPPPAAAAVAAEARRCSRYQFECHSGGECIAVYNACDGVPQCADGSDEAPELGCPAPPPAPTPPTPRAASLTTPAPAAPTPASAEVEAGVAAAAGGGSSAGGGEVAARWPHRLTLAQPPAPRRYSGAEIAPSSHIFSHKGGLLQEPGGVGMGGLGGAESGPEGVGGPQYAPFEPPWPRRPWGQLRPGLEGVAEERAWGAGGGYPREWPPPAPAPAPRRAWPVPPAPLDPEIPVYVPQKTMPEIPMVYSSQQQTLRDGPKKGPEPGGGFAQPPPPPPPPAPERAPPPPAPAQSAPAPPPPARPGSAHKETEVNHAVEAAPAAGAGAGARVGAGVGAGPAAAHVHFPAGGAGDEHDGLSEHPPAAVLLLVLGILMTAVMGGMLGCRARAVRRRLRRGRAALAHDADYLVNGMYL